jgi:hypothetical protein
MTLTEQWKKGELERGRYYIKYRGNYMSDNWHGDCWEDSWSDYVEEVLAPVPSYEEWQRIFHYASKYEYEYTSCAMDYENLKQENQQLKKWCEEFNALDVAKENKLLKTLLKEWMHFYPIILYEHEDTLKTKDIVELYEKTANAIGEK